MPTADIQSDDVAARLIMFSQAFDNGVVRDEKLWQFSKVENVNNRYETSIFLRRLLPQDGTVHALGCGLAETQNAQRGNPPAGDDKRRYYCGFSEAAVTKLTLKQDGFSTELVLQEEDGNVAHIAFYLQTKDGTRNERALWRTEALVTLSAALTPIKLHRCAADLHDRLHPTDRYGVKCYGRIQPLAAA